MMAHANDYLTGHAPLIHNDYGLLKSAVMTMYMYGVEKSNLQTSAAHLLRFGACVILNTVGFTGEEIKFLLRWKSRTFVMYLRNLAAFI